MQDLRALQNMNKRNVLVIGGAGFLGCAASEAFAELGANVDIASRNIVKCRLAVEDLTTKFSDSGQKHGAHQLDITDIESIRKLSKDYEERGVFLDTLVLCAWSGKKNSWDSIDIEDWRYDVEVCLTSNFLIVKEFEKLLKNKSKIIFVSSMYGVVAPSPALYADVPQANPPSYGAAKAGVIQLSSYLAAWLAHKRISVNCISPGPFPFDNVKQEFPEFVSRLEDRTLMKRVGLPEDLKGIFSLLGTDTADYITGQNFCIDGGWTVC